MAVACPGVSRTAATKPELWGGIECTVNRVDDHYRDQVVLSGHHRRESDLALFAELGLRAMRYPVLWERTAPDPLRPPDWEWPDSRLSQLRSLGVRPIIGLVHHGSGPRHTNLLDPDFATGLGHYAELVAARYPWVEDWTPINEPLTTARFSALYGHWHPHRRDERSFWLALLNQVDATRAAMRAIRRVNPAAKLIQTDDLGRTYSTAPLHRQAEYDNERRWAGWDLLFGRVDRHHALAEPLTRLGFGERLRQIADDPCPPDVIGVNHYLTSDRFLDHRTDRYPAHLRGGNGRSDYADTEAVRVLDPPTGGLARALRDAWTRYATPLALTEVHNGSTREEQMRWAAEAWDAAVDATSCGIDVRAVTAWSLLGSHGWNTLLTGDGDYESGVFDVAGGSPRATALATLWRGLPLGHERHPVATEAGWWRRPSRLVYPSHPSGIAVSDDQRLEGRAILIRHANGPVRDALIDVCRARGIRHAVEDADQADRPFARSPEQSSANFWLVIDIVTPTEAEGQRTDEGCLASIVSPVMDATADARHPAPLLLSLHLDDSREATPSLLGQAVDLAIDGEAGEWRLQQGARERPYTAA